MNIKTITLYVRSQCVYWQMLYFDAYFLWKFGQIATFVFDIFIDTVCIGRGDRNDVFGCFYKPFEHLLSLLRDRFMGFGG